MMVEAIPSQDAVTVDAESGRVTISQRYSWHGQEQAIFVAGLPNLNALIDALVSARAIVEAEEQGVVDPTAVPLLSFDPSHIRAARERRGLTQAELAKQAGTTQQTVDRIEKGQIRSSRFVARIRTILALPPVEGVPATELDDDQRSVAALIRNRLDVLNKSAASASLEAGLGRSVVQDILSGSTESPRLVTLQKLARVLECDVVDLIGKEAA